jgi:hypothetical protein
LTRLNASLRFSRSMTSSISCSLVAGLSVLRFAMTVSVPSLTALEASLLPAIVKASSNWFFCRFRLMSRAAYSPLPLIPYGNRSGLQSTVPGPASPAVSPLSGECPNRVDRLRLPTTPSADLCRAIRAPHGALSHASVTHGSPPKVSSTAFNAQPPDLRFAPLMDMGFAVHCPLAQRSRLLSGSSPSAHVFAPRFLQTRLTATPLRFANPSPPSGWIENFHLQAVEHAWHTMRDVSLRSA